LEEDDDATTENEASGRGGVVVRNGISLSIMLPVHGIIEFLSAKLAGARGEGRANLTLRVPTKGSTRIV
jgi:hypothetical protein